ncbi:MAG: class I SAM-dependent methyltransferase [Deltaproteobacteria bacterium]|nr:class I SAM-dependent methyltransferase [Deltaproteobacteria bacterium]
MTNNRPVDYSASEYDHFSSRYLDIYDQSIIGRVIEEVRQTGRPGTLLDIGAGSGQVLIKMARLPELVRFRLIGLDFFSDMVVQAWTAVQRAGLAGRIDLIRGDVHHLPCSEGAIDLVVSRSTIHHWARPAAALQEIYRILKPKGVAIIHEVRRDPNPESLAEFNRRRKEAGLEPSRLEGKYTAAEVSDLLRQAGLAGAATINAPQKGFGALGFEVRLARP